MWRDDESMGNVLGVDNHSICSMIMSNLFIKGVPMDKIETMRAFIAVAQEHSFTSAGRRLGISTKLVSKYVQHLEAQ